MISSFLFSHRISRLMLIAILLVALSNGRLQAATVWLESMREYSDHSMVEIRSSTAFIFGADSYYLHIGEAQWHQYRQIKQDQVYALQFELPIRLSAVVKEGAPIWFSYGQNSKDEPSSEAEVRALCAQLPLRCFFLELFHENRIVR